MNILKKALKYFGFTLLGLLLAGLLLPYVFKDKLINYLKNDINNSLNAIIDFDDANLSFIKSFPDVGISIDSLSIIGLEEFDGILLYKAEKTNVEVSLASLWGQNTIPRINSIVLEKPEINIVILDSLLANYLIAKATNGKSDSDQKFKLQLDKYIIRNGKLSYQDNTMNLFMLIDSLDHEGKGDFTQDIFDLQTFSKMEKLSVKYDGTQYLNNVKVELSANINMNFLENKYTLNNNILKLNELDIKGQGYFQFKDDDIFTDFKFRTASESFKALLSMIPNAYTPDFKDITTKGQATINGSIIGTYSESKKQMPAFDIDIKVADGYVKYPSLPQDIKDIYADINIKASRSDYKDMMVNIPSFKINIGNDPVSGHLIAKNLTGDQNVEGHLKGKINLKNIISAFPMDAVESLSGIINCDLSFNAKMSDINNENYNKIKFSGSANAYDIIYRSNGMPKIQIKEAVATASPQLLNFKGNKMYFGKSDLNMTASLKNPLAAFSMEKNVLVNISGNSDFFDLNEWMGKSEGTASKNNEQAQIPVDEKLLKNSSITMNLNGKKVLINEYVLDNINLDANIAANSMQINDFSAMLDGNDMKVSGTVINAYEYFFNNGILDGTLNLYSKKFNANKFMATNSSAPSTQPKAIIPVPENLRLTIHSDIKKLTYTNLELNDFTGNLIIQDKEVMLKDLKTNTLGGGISMNGVYNTKDLAKPDFSIKLDFSKINYAAAIKSIDMLKRAAPIAAYVDGFFNTTLIMKGKLGAEMTPELSTIDASGFLETLNGNIKGFKPFVELSEKLGIKELKEFNITNTKNWFEIVQGFIELKEFNKVFKGIDMTISGKHGFGKEMSYNIDLVIPRELMKKNNITGTVESGLAYLEKEAFKKGININQGPNIFLNVKMTGNLLNPKFQITPKTSKGESISNSMSDKINATTTMAKDSISKILKKKEGELKDTISKRANQELEKAKAKAESAAQKTIDSLKAKAKTVVTNKIDTLTKDIISDSLKQKAKDVIDSKSKEEIDKIKDKLKDFNPFKKKGKG